MTPPTNTTDAQHTNLERIFKAIRLIETKKEPMLSAEEEPLCIGTKIGPCDICKAQTKTYLLRYGFALCADCLNICAMILEQFQLDEENPPEKPRKIVSKPKIN